MPQTCSSNVIQYENFEFIDCSTINISYTTRGIASVSLSVVSTYDTIFGTYTELSFGGVNFSLVIREIQISQIPGTLVNVFNISMVGFGC
jgi:hypothetical protein